MAALVLPPLLALVLALALGGSLRGWAKLHLRWPFLLLVPFPILFALYNPPLEDQAWCITWGSRIWEIAQLTLVVGLARNLLARNGWQRLPWGLATLGVMLNALVVIANGGYMPVTPEAPAWIIARATADGLHNTIVMGATTQLNALGDVLLQPAWIPPRPNVVSVGDVLLSVGVAAWVFTNSRRRPATR